jgi:transposase
MPQHLVIAFIKEIARGFRDFTNYRVKILGSW